MTGERTDEPSDIRLRSGHCLSSSSVTCTRMSALQAAESDGEKLSEDDLLGFCFLLLIAGNDTTTSQVACVGHRNHLTSGRCKYCRRGSMNPSWLLALYERVANSDSNEAVFSCDQ
jgi:hypothetical protein